MTSRAGIPWLRTQLRQMPTPLVAMLSGAALIGATGGVLGLVLGLHTHPPTAWFAVLEVGVPAGVVGSVLGLFVGVVVRWRRSSQPSASTPVDDDFAGTPHRW